MAESADTDALKLACAIRAACVDAARQGYADASISGLCAEGAQEAALSAIESLDLAAVLERLQD